MKDLINVIKLIAKFPDKLGVRVSKSKDGGYWAEVVNLPGCFTQAESPMELLAMVNDAVYTYFDVPKKYISKMPIYLPEEMILKKIEANEIPSNILHNELQLQRV